MDLSERISAFLKTHNIRPHSENSRSYVFDCPACGGSQKLYIQKQDGLSVCFKRKSENCPSPGSTAEYALSLVSGIPFSQVKGEIRFFQAQLKDDLNVSLDDDIEVIKKKELKGGTLPADVTFIDKPNALDGLRYLEGRGLNVEVLKKNSVMYAPSMRRVIFPVIFDGKLCGWQGRAIDPVDKKYRMYNMEGDWRAHTLMFCNNLLNDNKFAIIAEGPVSALKFDAVGNYVATMGKEVSSSQLEILLALKLKRIYLALDRDAIDKVHKLRQTLISKSPEPIEIFLIDIPENRDDFGDCTFEECKTAFEKAKRIEGDEIMAHIEFKIGDINGKRKNV